MRLSRLGSSALFLVAATGLAACGGQPASPKTATSSANLARAYTQALEAEAKDPLAARGYLELLDAAAASPDAPGALAAAIAAVDALVSRNPAGLEEVSSAIAFRSRDGLPQIAARLQAAWKAAGKRPGPATAAVRGVIAQGLSTIALYTGSEAGAATWGARTGCVQEAAVVGPLDATPLRSLAEPSPVPSTGAFAASYPGVAPFAAKATPARVHADACRLDINATSFLQGLRAVVVDVDSPRPQHAVLALTSNGAATVDVGGARVLERSFALGGRAVTRMATVDLPAGKTRVVVHIAQRNDGNQIELDAWGDDGEPLRATAPRAGDVANGRAGQTHAIEIAPVAKDPDSVALAAAGLLGFGEARAAEHLLEPPPDALAAGAMTRTPAIHALYARAVDAADDLPDVKAIERLRAEVDKVLEAWPGAWEAMIGHARLTNRRRGVGDGPVEALKEMGVRPGDAPSLGGASGANPATLAYVALLAKKAQLLDVSEAAYTALAKLSAGSPLLANVDARLHKRGGADAVAAACQGGRDKSDNGCLDAHRTSGDFAGALAEIGRLRTLRRDPEALRADEIYLRIQMGDRKGALAVYDAMAPGHREMLSVLGYAAATGDAKDAVARLARDRLDARDAPYSIAPLDSILTDKDPAREFEATSAELVATDRAHPYLPGAGTAVLSHVERYSIAKSGLVAYVYYDLRRVSGTTDVEMGAQSFGPRVEGRGAPRLLRRRIYKKDGRVLEPDAAQYASQGHSDLSQLEQGDYVEQIVHGYALPGDTGQLVLDTPDLLPERQSVREAVIEVRRDASIPFEVWSHPLLGKATEKRDGDTLVQSWRLSNAAPRRIEDGVPRMERSVSVSMGTLTWTEIAHALADNLRAFVDRDPYVARWAQEAAGADKTPNKALVERVVAAAGKTIKVASGNELGDVAAIYGGGAQSENARSILELGQGSRSWVVYRALKELGVDAQIALAETEPFSSAVNFPAHVGRFRHPLVVAKVDDGELWIDADVEGPPLPPGRVSPELRGRSAMLPSGQIIPVQGASAEAGDEIDIRLALDEKGNAKGTFTILLHGRPAQGLSDAFETVVGTERMQLLRNVVLGWLPWADVEDVSLSSNEGSWEVALRATIAIHGYGRPEGKDGKTWVLPGLEPVHLVFPNNFVGTLGATYASRGARESALAIATTMQYHVHRRVELPKGATVVKAAEKVDVRDPRIEASRKATFDGKAIEEELRLNLPTGTIPAEAYQPFVEKVHAVDDGFMAGTRVSTKGK
jgi:hypothetical protein